MKRLYSTPALVLWIFLAAICGFIAWRMGWVEWAFTLKEPILDWCRSNPLVLFAAIAILPGVGFPASPLFLLAGVVWGSTPAGCALAMLAVLVNITWCHLLAAGPGNKIIIRLLGSRWQRWQEMPAAEHWRVVCLLRVTPGIPLFVQNYLIGLIRVPLRYSLALSTPITGLYVCGFVLTGGAIFQGQIGLLIAGISILIAATLAVKTIRRRLAPTGTGVSYRP